MLNRIADRVHKHINSFVRKFLQVSYGQAKIHVFSTHLISIMLLFGCTINHSFHF